MDRKIGINYQQISLQKIHVQQQVQMLIRKDVMIVYLILYQHIRRISLLVSVLLVQSKCLLFYLLLLSIVVKMSIRVCECRENKTFSPPPPSYCSIKNYFILFFLSAVPCVISFKKNNHFFKWVCGI